MILDQKDLANLNSSNLMQSLKQIATNKTLNESNPVGTPYYLAPEIWKERAYSKLSDVWALGVILYELLNLRKPFPATSKEELINKVYKDPYDKIRQGISQPL